MSKPKAPTPPDPVATANAQTASNEATARTNAELNRVDQITPYGSVTYGHNGDHWTQTVNESANQQQLREGQENLGIDLNHLATDQVGHVSDILGTNFDPTGYSTRTDNGGRLDLAEAMGGNFDSSRYDPTNSHLDLSGFDPTHVGAMDLSGYDPTQKLGDFGKDIQSRQYDLATQGLDKKFNTSEEALRSRLADQGITVGSQAFNDEMAAFNEGKGNAYAGAMHDAADTALAARGQAAGELEQGAGLSQAERADLLSRMQTGAGYAGAENADALSRLGQGFSQGLAGRQQDMSEILGERQQNNAEGEADWSRNYDLDLARRQIPLQEIMGIMNGTPLTPINPGQASSTNVANTDVAGINRDSWNAAYQNYAQQMAGRNAIIGGISGLVGTGIGAWAGG